MSQSYGAIGIGQLGEAESAEDWGRPSMDAVDNQAQDSESIEGISDLEELEDDVFLAYFMLIVTGKRSQSQRRGDWCRRSGA